MSPTNDLENCLSDRTDPTDKNGAGVDLADEFRSALIRSAQALPSLGR